MLKGNLSVTLGARVIRYGQLHMGFALPTQGGDTSIMVQTAQAVRRCSDRGDAVGQPRD